MKKRDKFTLPFMEKVAVNNAEAKSERMTAPRKLMLLVTVVNRQKAEFYADLIQSYEVNMQLITAAEGTATTETLHYLGLTETDKSVIFSVVREDRAPAIMAALENRFKTVKKGKGIAFTVPMSGTIGVAIYQFLSNTQS